MPFYGEPDLGIEYRYVAVTYIRAEHPVGSGTVVEYKPGDYFPGEDWGSAAANLVEVGKAVRLAINVVPNGGTVMVPPSEPEPSSREATLESYMGEWPVKGAAGWYTLSDGSRVRGEEAANDAQRLLDEG